MTVDFRHPLYHEKAASNFFITADLFLCLIKVYEDFSQLEPSFELTRYYDVYLEVTPNKKILKVLFSVHNNYEKYLLNTISYFYDIERKRLLSENDKDALEEKIDIVRSDFQDNLNGIVCPAIILKMIKQAWRYFIQHNERGAPLKLHAFGFTFFSDRNLFIILVQPWIDPIDWMNGTVEGIESYLFFDLITLKIIKTYHSPAKISYFNRNHKDKRRLNACLNKKKKLKEAKNLTNKELGCTRN